MSERTEFDQPTKGRMTTCKAWIPTDSGSRYCGEPATHRMLTRWDGMVSVCQLHYEEARGKP